MACLSSSKHIDNVSRTSGGLYVAGLPTGFQSRSLKLLLVPGFANRPVLLGVKSIPFDECVDPRDLSTLHSGIRGE